MTLSLSTPTYADREKRPFLYVMGHSIESYSFELNSFKLYLCLCIYLVLIICHPTKADGDIDLAFIPVSIRPSVTKRVSATPPRRHIRLS